MGILRKAAAAGVGIGLVLATGCETESGDSRAESVGPPVGVTATEACERIMDELGSSALSTLGPLTVERGDARLSPGMEQRYDWDSVDLLCNGTPVSGSMAKVVLNLEMTPAGDPNGRLGGDFFVSLQEGADAVQLWGEQKQGDQFKRIELTLPDGFDAESTIVEAVCGPGQVPRVSALAEGRVQDAVVECTDGTAVWVPDFARTAPTQ
jgi:hypothetical protein